MGGGVPYIYMYIHTCSGLSGAVVYGVYYALYGTRNLVHSI